MRIEPGYYRAMTSQQLKEAIKETAFDLGFQRTVIASLEPMETERQEYERWLALGYAAGMEYLKRNPHFGTSPQLLYPEGRSAIVVSVSYYSEVPEPPPGFFRQGCALCRWTGLPCCDSGKVART